MKEECLPVVIAVRSGSVWVTTGVTSAADKVKGALGKLKIGWSSRVLLPLVLRGCWIALGKGIEVRSCPKIGAFIVVSGADTETFNDLVGCLVPDLEGHGMTDVVSNPNKVAKAFSRVGEC